MYCIIQNIETLSVLSSIMNKLLPLTLLTMITLSQPAVATPVIYGGENVLKTELAEKNLKPDIIKNADLLLYVNAHTEAMLIFGGELKLNPNLSDQEFSKRMADLEAVAEQRQSIYLYDLISALYAAKLNAVNPQGIYDLNNKYAKKHIEYVKKCYEEDAVNCNVSAYVANYYSITKQPHLAQSWLEKGSK